MRIALAGGVRSSDVTLAALLRHRMDVVGVLGLAPRDRAEVSAFADLGPSARAAGIPFVPFENVNDESIVRAAAAWKPDLLFVVGLSQLIRRPLMAVPRRAAVGFHPTRLPQGRGRAPLAWLALGACPGAATFFQIDAGVDSGPILVQEPFEVPAGAYVSDIYSSMERAIDRALDRWLPQLRSGAWEPVPQDDSKATYLGSRSPADGLIRWSDSASRIAALVRAASEPHPGAYTYLGDVKLTIWRADPVADPRHRGVEGSILHVDDRGLLVQTGEGVLEITRFELESPSAPPRSLRAGLRLGVDQEREVHRLRERIRRLEARLSPTDPESS